MAELLGKIAGVVFVNKNNGYHVLKFDPDKGSQIKVAGTFPGFSLSGGMRLKLIGDYQDHPSYGRQFSATVCEVIPERNRSGIISYLSSNIPSIGPVTAAKLFDAFGESLLDVLDKDIARLNSCDFLTNTQVAAITKEWQACSDSRNSSVYLSDLGLSTSQIKSVFTIFGVDCKAQIIADPYSLIRVPGIGFVTSDGIARRLNVGVDDIRRVQAIVLYVIQDMMQSEGHVYVKSSQVIDYVSKRFFKKFQVDAFSYGEYLSESLFYGALTTLSHSNFVACDEDKIYLTDSFKKECETADLVARFLLAEPIKFNDIDDIVSQFANDNKIEFSDDQLSAIELLKSHRLAVISGFPGTGKTTLISTFVEIFEKHNLNYTLLSPTGIAAKRLSQVTGKPASTIHRALGCKKDGTWEFNASNKYYTDAIIVDEMSMVDASIFHHLMMTISPNAIVVLVGDSAQLPSVGSGFILKDLLLSDLVPKVVLTRIFRQGKTSDIISVAHGILKDEPIETGFNRDSEFVFLRYSQDQVLSELISLCTRLKANEKNFQVIAPVYDGILGVNNLNASLRPVLNPLSSMKGAVIKQGDSSLVEGDRVMIIKNDYDRYVYNGDVGKILKIDLKNDAVDVKVFDWIDNTRTGNSYVDKVFTFKVDEARQMLRVAYACTTHKVQGQEFDYVVMPMTTSYGHMLYKNLVYTAITRARKKVFIIGDPNAFVYATKNTRDLSRQTNLPERIIHSYKIQAVKSVTLS